MKKQMINGLVLSFYITKFRSKLSDFTCQITVLLKQSQILQNRILFYGKTSKAFEPPKQLKIAKVGKLGKKHAKLQNWKYRLNES